MNDSQLETKAVEGANAKSVLSSALQRQLERHFIASAVKVGGAVAVAALGAAGAEGAVIYSGLLNLTIPQNNFAGIYFNFDNGTRATTNVAGTDANIFDYVAGSSSFSYRVQGFFGAGATGNTVNASLSDAAGTNALKLSTGTIIGPSASNTFDRSNLLAYRLYSYGTPITGRIGSFAAPGTGFLGLRFLSATGTTDYAWMRLSVAANGNITVVDYAYDNTGAAIAAGSLTAVPEPGSLALGCLAAGAMGLGAWRNRRKQRQASEEAAALTA